MAFDLAAHLGAMTREVHNLEKDGQPAKAVLASRVYDTTPADLWDALTSPERIRRWFAPVTGDLQRGGRYHVEGNASGTVLECGAPDGCGRTQLHASPVRESPVHEPQEGN